jgi:hypothetical protein
MTFRFSCLLTAFIAPLIIPAAAQANLAIKAVQCAAVIDLSIANWPADHPSTAQAKALKAEWLSFATVTAFPKTIDVETALAREKYDIQLIVVGMRDEPSRAQTYMAKVSQGCDAVPFTPLSPAICKTYASAEAEGAALMESMVAYNASFDDTPEKRANTAKQARKAVADRAQAQAAMTHFARAGDMTQKEAMDVISTLDPDARKARYQTCLKQMG